MSLTAILVITENCLGRMKDGCSQTITSLHHTTLAVLLY